MAALPFAHHLTMVPHFPGGPVFLLQPSRLWSPSLLLSQAASPLPTAIPSPGPPSKPHSPAPSHPLHQETHNSGWGAQCCDTDHTHRSHSVPPSTDQLPHSPLIPQSPEGLSLSPLIPSPWVGPSECGNLFSSLAPLQGRQSCPASSFLPPSFPPCHTQLHRDSSSPHGCLRSPTSAQ